VIYKDELCIAKNPMPRALADATAEELRSRSELRPERAPCTKPLKAAGNRGEASCTGGGDCAILGAEKTTINGGKNDG